MQSLLTWFDERTGLVTGLGNWLRRPMAGGPGWRFVWPTTIVFAFVVQAITGLVLWMYYSPGAQSAWESVYYLQHHVLGGWLLRAIHYYTGQIALVLAGIYLVQMIFRATYRAPREFLFWTVLLTGLATLGLNLTGDLLAWDQNAYWATQIRTAYLSHTPVLGPWLCKLAVGGSQFGTFTLTRFLALHIGLFAVALAGLLLAHAHLAARHGMESGAAGSSETGPQAAGEAYWPQQAWRDAVACLAVLAVVLGLSISHGVGPNAGRELGSPANPVEDPGTARPEWSFRGLYQLHETLSAWPEIVSIMVIPGVTVLLFLAMPLIGRGPVGRWLNVVIAVFVLGGLAVLSVQSYVNDARNAPYQAALSAEHELALRVKELAVQPTPEEVQKAKESGERPPLQAAIPVSGALTLLNNDPKTQGPRLFNQHCASCHDYSGPARGVSRPEKPTAPDLFGFATRPWLTELMTPEGISSAKYFGNTKFSGGDMAKYLNSQFSKYEASRKEQILEALLAEADFTPQPVDEDTRKKIAAGRKFIAEKCAECHSYHDEGSDTAPDLTGYGSRRWIADIIANPAHPRFYGKRNDRMPAYAESPDDPKKNLLSPREIELLARWLRGDWYEPEGK